MDLRKRTLLAGGAAAGFSWVMPAWARQRGVAPLLLVLDIDTPGARKAFDDFRAMLDRRFAGTATPPVARFGAVKDEVTDQNRAAIKALVDAERPAILLASNSGLADMAASLNLRIPIIFFSTADPVAKGLTDSLTRPSKGMTGFTLGASADHKRREMLLRLFPKCRVMGLLSSENDIGEGIRQAGRDPLLLAGGVKAIRFNNDGLEDLKRILASREARQVDAWDVAYVHVPFRYPEETVRLFNQLKKPVMYPRMKHVRMGGMAAFEPRIDEADEAWVSQVSSLLAGVPITDIPVVQASRYSFGLNLKACRRVGIEPPKALLKIADLVIE